MIKIEKVKVVGLEEAIRGMRNPKNSWDRSDSYHTHVTDSEVPVTVDSEFHLGENDHELMMTLANGGPVHAKYRRMIVVYLDITAPLYWWKEFDTYKVGTVANSCSTMHKLADKEFTIDDFSHEHLLDEVIEVTPFCHYTAPLDRLDTIVAHLNVYRKLYLETKDKRYWWQMIQLLPSSYNQKRTIMLNYEVLTGMYKYRNSHKLDEWVEFCKWIETLPYSEIIIPARTEGKETEEKETAETDGYALVTIEYKRLFDSFVKQGFTEDQALTLVIQCTNKHDSAPPPKNIPRRKVK